MWFTTLRFWTLNCVIPHFHIAGDYYCNKAEWTPLKVAFLVFVPVVVADEFAKNTIFILSMCTQLTPFNTIWPDFCILYPIYPIDSFQHHLTWFLHSVPNWLLSRPYDLIFTLCTQFTQLTPFKTILPDFCILYLIDFLSRPHDLIFSLCTLIIPFKTIWSNFVIVHPIDCSQYHFVWFFYFVHNWLLSRPFDLFFINVYPIEKVHLDHLDVLPYVENALIISSDTYKEVLPQLVSTSNKTPSSGDHEEWPDEGWYSVQKLTWHFQRPQDDLWFLYMSHLLWRLIDLWSVTICRSKLTCAIKCTQVWGHIFNTILSD